MKYRSSIFSSESLAVSEIPRDWLATLALTLFLLVAAEATARVLLAPLGDHLWAYDSPSMAKSFEWYRERAASGEPPTVLAIGDSTGQRNFDASVFASAAAIDSVYSLALAGNFPRSLRSNTLPLLDVESVPEVVLLFQWPGSLRDDPRTDQIEAGMVSSILEAQLDGRLMISDFLYLTRLFRSRSHIIDYWLRDKPLLRPAPNGGFSPFTPESAARIEADPDATLDESESFSPARRQVVENLVDVAARRDFLLVAVVGPYRTGTEYVFGARHLDWLLELEQQSCGHLVALDVRDLQLLEHSDFRDNHHLYASGAEKFSGFLGDQVGQIRKAAARNSKECSGRFP